MSAEEYRPRFSFEISEEQKKRADVLLSTHGLRRGIFSPILDDILDMIEQHGMMVAGVILDGQAKPREIIPIMAKAEKKAGGR